MKKILLRNYMLMIIAWFLVLDDYLVLGLLLGVLGSYIMLRSWKLNYWRLLAFGLLMFNCLEAILQLSNIPYFFPNITYFILLMSLNAAITNEFIYIFKAKALYSVALMSTLALIAFLIILAVLPGDLYTLFSKASLFVLICFIFLPYIIPVYVCIFYKSASKRPVIRKKEATSM